MTYYIYLQYPHAILNTLEGAEGKGRL